MNSLQSNRNYFELMGLPVGCDVDLVQLEQRYRQLQSDLHPDRFVNAAAEQRLAALQQSSLFNEAYTTLKSPLRRAGHLLALRGIDVHEHVQAQLDGDFLFAQMQRREALETLQDNNDLDGLAAMLSETQHELSDVWHDFASSMKTTNHDAAKRAFHKMQFLHKLIDEIAEAEDRLLD